MANFYSIITNRGKELEAEALASGTKITLVKFVVGDGNGQATPPKPTQTKLVNEKYRGDIGELSVSPDQSTQMMAKIVLPTDVGGFTVREIGILTDAGELYAVANCAAIEKPVGGVSVNMQFRLAVSDTANITLNVATGDGLFLRIDQDLSEIRGRGALAQKAARESLAVVDASTKQKGLVQLNSATNSTSETQAATPAAVKAVKDSAVQREGNLSDIADKAKARENLGLVKQTSQTDSTSDAVLLNGAWGVGAVVIPIPDNTDIYTYFLTAKTGFYRIGQLVTNGVFKGADFIWALHSLNSATGKAAYGNLYELSTDGIGSAIHTLKAGEWSVSRNYSDKYKPTAKDTGALPSTGGTLNGNLTVKNQIQVGGVGSGALNIGDSDSGLRSSIEGQVDLFANGRTYGYWNATELTFTGRIIPTDYTNFNARYASGDSFYDTNANTGMRTRDKKFLLSIGTDGTMGFWNEAKQQFVFWVDSEGKLTKGIVPAASVSGLAEVGVNQTWRDVTLQRALNTAYTNSSGKPIYISVTGKNQQQQSFVDLWVGSAKACRTYKDSNSDAPLTAIIPAGATYKIISTGGTLSNWAELS